MYYSSLTKKTLTLTEDRDSEAVHVGASLVSDDKPEYNASRIKTNPKQYLQM